VTPPDGPGEGALPWRDPAARALFRLLPAEVLCYADTSARVFALTFDDVPHPATTPDLLDVLARHSARATFFLIGERVPGNEAIVERIAAEGHELGNHLMRDERSALMPAARFREELAEVTALLARYGPVRWVRPGSGWFTPYMMRAARERDLRLALGTLVAMHTGGPGDRRIAAMLAGEVRPGSIVVLHEGMETRRGVVEAVDELLTRLTADGFAAVTISELADMDR
jgi:peptidoglycan-N-acetylglucosamine deacetylase